MPRVIHFEIGAVDVDKILKFYKEIFGWKVDKWEGEEPYWLITTGDTSKPGINGGVFKSKGEAVMTNVIDVDNIDEMTKKVESAGGTIVVPKMAVPGIGWAVYFKDIEGNLLGLMQADSEAK
jgi:uncharacterized protein